MKKTNARYSKAITRSAIQMQTLATPSAPLSPNDPPSYRADVSKSSGTALNPESQSISSPPPYSLVAPNSIERDEAPPSVQSVPATTHSMPVTKSSVPAMTSKGNFSNSTYTTKSFVTTSIETTNNVNKNSTKEAPKARCSGPILGWWWLDIVILAIIMLFATGVWTNYNVDLEVSG